MTTIACVVPPHRVDDVAKVASLVEAYEAGADVPPPVVLVLGETWRAISGSHRLAALREVFGTDADAEEHVLAVDGEALYETHADALDELIADGGVDYGALVDLLWSDLPEAARFALADQRGC